MSRESEWVKFVLHEEFPPDVEFLEGSAPNHVVVEWQVVGPDDAPRRNAPFVIVIDTEAIDRAQVPHVVEDGCLKGAVVGGVAGHYAGHHAVVGAVGGCVVGRHLAKKHAQEQAAQRQAAQVQ